MLMLLNMNNIFQPVRFVYLFRKTLLEKPVQIFGIVILNLVVVLLMYAFLRDIIGWQGTQNLTFVWGFVFGGCYLSAAVFSNFNTNAGGSSFLTLPASHLEKWLCGILITWVLYVIVFLLYFKGVDAMFVGYYHRHLNPLEVGYQNKLEGVQMLDYGGHVAQMAYLIFANLTAAMFVGSLYFNKISFVKTGLVVCAALVFFYGANLALAHIMFPDVSDAFPFSHVSIGLPSGTQVNELSLAIRPKSEEGSVSLSSPYIDIYRVTVRYILTSTLCIAAFIRLKEKEF
jgi:hypothetical protein